MTENKKTPVTYSVTVGAKDSTVTDLLEAQKYVGAPNSARVVVNNVGPSYNSDGQVDENYLPFNITFSWTEDK